MIKLTNLFCHFLDNFYFFQFLSIIQIVITLKNICNIKEGLNYTRTYMQLQQNIFLFHKTFMKIPRWFFMAICIIIIGLIGYESLQAFRLWGVTQTNIQSVSNCFLQYHKKTNPHYNCEYLIPQPQKEDKKPTDNNGKIQGNQKFVIQQNNKDPTLPVQKQQKEQVNINQNNKGQAVQIKPQKQQIKEPSIKQTIDTSNQDNPKEKQQSPAKKQNEEQQKVEPTKDQKQKQKKQKQSQEEHNKGLFQILNDTTLIDIDFKGQKCHININNQIHDQKNQTNTFSYHEQQLNAFVVKNDHILFLPKIPQYRKEHNIIYHTISIPFKLAGQFLIGSELMSKRQSLIYSMSEGFAQLEDKIYAEHSQIPRKYYIQNLKIFARADFGQHSSYIPFKNWHFALLTQILIIIMSLWVIVISSLLFGLVVRFSIISIITLYLIVGGRANFGWYQEYLNLIRARNFTSLYYKFWLSIGMLTLFSFIAFGSYKIMKHIGYYQMKQALNHPYYCYRFMKTVFFMELCHYLFMHTRTTIYYYSRITTLISLCMTIFVGLNPYYFTQYIMTVYQLVQALITIIMFLIEQQVLKSPFYSEFTPNITKPRMLFYVGYQLSWHQTIPPIWTYFTQWFDWTLTSQKQRVLLDGDYQLLYGMILGMNERHPLPQDEENNQDTQLRVLNESQ